MIILWINLCFPNQSGHTAAAQAFFERGLVDILALNGKVFNK